jgi:hypothetical protein
LPPFSTLKIKHTILQQIKNTHAKIKQIQSTNTHTHANIIHTNTHTRARVRKRSNLNRRKLTQNITLIHYNQTHTHSKQINKLVKHSTQSTSSNTVKHKLTVLIILVLMTNTYKQTSSHTPTYLAQLLTHSLTHSLNPTLPRSERTGTA